MFIDHPDHLSTVRVTADPDNMIFGVAGNPETGVVAGEDQYLPARVEGGKVLLLIGHAGRSEHREPRLTSGDGASVFSASPGLVLTISRVAFSRTRMLVFAATHHNWERTRARCSPSSGSN